jgi:hypothetical protein
VKTRNLKAELKAGRKLLGNAARAMVNSAARPSDGPAA